MSKVINLKLMVDCLGFKKDQIISVSADEKEVPLDLFWKSRLEDNCVSLCREAVKDFSSGVKKDKK